MLSTDVGLINPYPIPVTIVRSSATLSTDSNFTFTLTTHNPYPSLNGGKVIVYVPKDQISITTLSQVAFQRADNNGILTSVSD